MSKKQTVISIISVALILIFCIFYAVAMRTIASAAIGAKFFENNTLVVDDFILIDSIFNKAIVVELGIFSLIQVLSYTMYLLKNKKVLKILFIIEIAILILTLIKIIIYDNLGLIIFALPGFNIGLYLLGLKEEKLKKQK